MILSRWILLFIVLFLFAENIHAVHHRRLTKEKRYEKYLITRIRNLKQVKRFFYLHAHSCVMIDKTPDSINTTYYVVVGIMHHDQFLTFWRFEANQKTNKITVEDDIDTDHNIFIPLQLWQRWFFDARFKKPHHYKNGQIYVTK